MWILLKSLYLLVFSFIVIFLYYNSYSFHIESFSWSYLWYILSIITLYLIYRVWNYVNWKKEISFSPLSIFWWFLLHLLIICVIFFRFNSQPGGFWIVMFFNIFWYLLFSILILFLCYTFWKYLFDFIKWSDKEHDYFKFLVSLWLWMVFFITILTLFWFFGFYNIWVVFGILVIFGIFSYKQILKALKWIIWYKFVFKNHDFKSQKLSQKINFNLLSTEFFFIISTLLISVNLVSINRPMPIGWDDMWVYMNYPQLFANAGEILNLWWMFSWQVFTGIWYMMKTPTLAFVLNNVWWVLSLIVIILSFSSLLNNKKDSFLNLPFMAWTIFLAMPMIVFQQAKDMKLDPWLFFFSALSIYMLFYLFIRYIWYKDSLQKNIKNEHITINLEKNQEWQKIEIYDEKIWKKSFFQKILTYTHLWEDVFSKKEFYIYIFLIWIFSWFAFSVKMTSLLLISAIIWVFFYAKLGVAWFFWYIAIYTAIFTKAWLWSMMNVIYPKDNIDLINAIFLWLSLVWIILFIYSLKKYGLSAFNRFFVILWVFLTWVIIILLPWILKNYLTLNWDISIWWLLSWKWDSFKIDYEKIYSKEELEKINKVENIWLSKSWITTNEDFWRYFGYEKWINNYIKLPYNLSMQVNQKGEYTDITYLYLALVPVLIIFLSYKNILFLIPSFFWWLFFVLFLFSKDIVFFNWLHQKFTLFLEWYELPWWYILILLFFIIPFLYFMYSLSKDRFSQLFRLNLVFLVFYVFLWTISAFWIVWYGISMYYWFLFIIVLSACYFVYFDDRIDDYKNIVFKFIRSFVLFFIVWVYIFASVIPHAMTNLKNSSYITFKIWKTDKYQTIFITQPHYFNVLKTLNLKDEKLLFDDIISKIKSNSILKKIIEKNKINDLNWLQNLFVEFINISDSKQKQDLKIAIDEVNDLSSYMYKNILYPPKNNKNEVWIYRIWTFLRYFISDNYKRLFDDSLINEFDKYFYDEKNVDLSIERMQKIWVNYFLVDLNAATIDRDPRKDLTRRYETLLHTFTSDKLKLIETDSLCLKTAIELFHNSLIDFEEFKLIAWVNYESYDKNWKLLYNRGEKQLMCYNKILNLLQEDKINETSYNYLLPIKNYIIQNQIKTEQELLQFFQNYVWHWWMALFEIKK